MTNHPLAGVYAAAVTPLNQDYSIALDDIPEFLAFLAKRGCHGALLIRHNWGRTIFLAQ